MAIDRNIGGSGTGTGRGVANKVATVGSISALKTFTGPEDSVIVQGYYTPGDGGGGEFYWDSTSTATANGGTIIQATGVTTGRWIRVYSGAINVKWFGASPLVADNTIYINNALDAASNSGALYFPSGTYHSDSIEMTGVFDLMIYGDGTSSIIDFDLVTAGDGLKITDDATSGGFQRISLKDITFTDSSSTSSVTNLIVLDGGATGSSPSRVGGFVSLRNVATLAHNNTAGIGLLLRNISHITIEDFYQGYRQKSQYGVVIDNDIDINTGVIKLSNCHLYGSTTGLYIHQTINLLDTFTVNNCFISSYSATSSAEAVRIESTGVIECLSFIGNHIENTNTALDAAVKIINATLTSSTFKNNHFSCGNVTNQNTYGIQFDNATLKGCSFEQNQFLRIKASGAGGACYRFENTCVLDVDEPVEIRGVYRNSTSASMISVESGGNEDLIWSGIVTNPMEVTRILTNSATNTVTTITPPRQEFIMSLIVNNSPTHAGTCYVRCGSGGAGITSLGGGADFVTGTGVPTGTTGVANSLGIYAHTDGNIYIENRTGNAIGFSIQYIHGYYGNP